MCSTFDSGVRVQVSVRRMKLTGQICPDVLYLTHRSISVTCGAQKNSVFNGNVLTDPPLALRRNGMDGQIFETRVIMFCDEYPRVKNEIETGGAGRLRNTRHSIRRTRNNDGT